MFSVQTFKNMKKGFTLIELMVVIAVIAILATVALFGLRGAQGSARNTQRLQIMNALRAVQERYYGDKNVYLVGTSFSTLYATLTSLNYLSGGAYVDPGCGGGPVTISDTAANATMWVAASGNWVPCGAGGGVTYTYGTGTTAAYTTAVYKEGGGSTTYTGPQ